MAFRYLTQIFLSLMVVIFISNIVAQETTKTEAPDMTTDPMDVTTSSSNETSTASSMLWSVGAMVASTVATVIL